MGSMLAYISQFMGRQTALDMAVANIDRPSMALVAIAIDVTVVVVDVTRALAHRTQLMGPSKFHPRAHKGSLRPGWQPGGQETTAAELQAWMDSCEFVWKGFPEMFCMRGFIFI